MKQYGGVIGVRDAGVLSSALHRPLTRFRGGQKYTSPVERAAALWVALIRNHGFVDGNNRTATTAMARWLLMEGYRVRSGQHELVEAAVSIATNELDEGGAAEWLRSHSERVQ
jgi:death-on-curing protein